MIRTVAYCRVSTNSKDQANSLENQKSYFDREISKNRDFEFVSIYADKGFSGTKLSRPEFDRMLFDAGLDIIEVKNNDNDNRKEKIKYVTIPSTTRKPNFDRILVKNTSRFARNVLVEDILRDLRQNKVYVHFLDLDKCTESNEDITYIQIFQSFDERESRDKSKKVLFGIEEGTKRGMINPGHNLYGYSYLKEENRLLINKEESEVIKLIFELYGDGLGLRRIRNVLNEKNIKTRKSKEFCKSTLRRILTNEKYIGLSIRRKYDTGLVFDKTSYPKVRPQNEWLTDWNKSEKIPAIVTDELFNKCQKIMQSSISHITQKGIYKGTTEYAGIITCGLCGSKYISNVDRGCRFYNCNMKKSKGLKGCVNNNVSVKLLEKVINEDSYKKSLLLYKNYYTLPLMYLWMSLEKKLNEVNNEKILGSLNEELLKLEDKKSKLIDLYTDSIISKDELILKTEPIEISISNYRKQINDFLKPRNEILNDIQEVLETYKKIESIKIKDSYSKEEILNDIEKIIVYSNKEIQVTYKTKYIVEKMVAKYNLKDVNTIESALNTNIFENMNFWNAAINNEELANHVTF